MIGEFSYKNTRGVISSLVPGGEDCQAGYAEGQTYYCQPQEGGVRYQEPRTEISKRFVQNVSFGGRNVVSGDRNASPRRL